MKDRKICRVLTVALLFIYVFAFQVMSKGSESAPIQSPAPQLLAAPLSFEPNQGQTDGSVKFLSRGDGYVLFLTSNEAVFKLSSRTGARNAYSVLRMGFQGANESSEISVMEKLSATANYFIGSDPKKWHSGVPTYGKVNYRGIYPGVDVVFYGNQRELEYDFAVAPGADASRIAMTFSGAKPKVDRDGNVLLSLGGNSITLHKAVLYQGKGSDRKSIDGSYVVAGNRVHLRIGPYDHSQPLVIDPVISYLTYLGGSTGINGNAAVTSIGCRPNACPPGYSYQRGQGIAVDSSGSVYVTGQTWTTDFPTQNPLQAKNNSLTNQFTAYVTKLNPTGTGLIYSTYLGGSVNEEADAIAIDSNGSAYVAGLTFSGDFPTTPGSFTSKCPVQAPGPPVLTYCQSGSAAFLTKLSPDGQSLSYSTYLITPGSSIPIRSVAVDAQGRAYVVGDYSAYCSENSNPSCFFPTTSNALLPYSLFDQTVNPHTFNPGMAYLTVFSADGSGLVYSTLFGDSDPSAHGNYGNQTLNYTRATGVAVDPDGNFYIAGITADPNIPVTANAFQPNYVAFLTADRSYVAKFSPIDSAGGPQLAYGTYLGAMNTDLNASDEIYGIVADASGSAVVTGLTQNPGFPTTAGTYNSGPCGALNNGNCGHGAFVTKFTPDGTGLAWSTLLSYATSFTGNGYNGVQVILPPRLDNRGNVYVEVQSSLGYPEVNPVQTFTDFSAKLGITKFDPTGSRVFFSTLLGGITGSTQYGASNQFPAGLDVDAEGNIYVAGMTSGGDLPTTPDAFQSAFPLTSNNNTGFIAKINPFLEDSTTLAIDPTTATAGQTITFTATVNSNQKATGSVNFMNGATLLGTGTLDSNGIATFSTANLVSGTYSVTAAYLGDDTFAPSTSDPQNLTINSSRAAQTIAFDALPNVTYGVAPVTLAATASSGLPVSYTVTGPATLNGSSLTISGVGTIAVTALQIGNTSYLSATPVKQSFIVSPAVLTVAATNLSVAFNQPIPALTYTVMGFVNGESATVVSGTPTESTAATVGSTPGSYPIIISQGTLFAANYAFSYINGTLIIIPATQMITFNTIAAQIVGASVPLVATASSGLPVSFSSLTTAVCTVSGTSATMVTAGTCSIQASQAGNTNYQAAASVTQSFSVTSSSGASFTITPEPQSEIVSRGVAAAFVLQLHSVNGFKGNVKLACSGGPAGSQCLNLPSIVYLNGTAYALSGILFPRNATPATYTITFTGTSGALTATATAKFTVK